MWTFKDRGDRDVCLIPEVTAIIQETYNNSWTRKPKPVKVFYVNRCYRYERPQKGRYREFTQFGIEILGWKNPDDKIEAMTLLEKCFKEFDVNWQLSESVKRGIGYYVEDGFEVECPDLGAQKQVAGGGRYAEGIGWAIGIDRLMLAIKGESC